MNKRILIGIMAISICLICAGALYVYKPSDLSPKPMSDLPELTVIQATDLHYLSEKLTDHGTFFKKIVDDGDGKVMHYSETLMKAFLEEMVQVKPSVLILSGDLTLNGEKISHEDLSRELKKVEEAGVIVLVMPGNHDLNNSMAVKYVKDSYERVETVNAKTFKAIYNDYGYSEAMARDGASLSYMYSVSDSLRVLMVDVNTDDAPGQLKTETVSWVESQLKKAKQDGVRVIAVSHQNMLQHNSLFAGGFVFEGSEALLKLYEDYSVICNLSGHMHIQHVQTSSRDFTEVATSSLAITPNQYGVIKLDKSGLRYQTNPINMADYVSRHHMTDNQLIHFAEYSKAYFMDSAKKKLLSQIKITPNAEAAALYFAKLNEAYFTGRNDQLPERSDLIDLPEIKNTFLSPYMESIYMEVPKNHNVFEIKVSE